MSKDGDTHRVLVALRQMAWQRAKGELIGILETFWDEREEYEKLAALIRGFIHEIEDGSCLG